MIAQILGIRESICSFRLVSLELQILFIVSVFYWISYHFATSFYAPKLKIFVYSHYDKVMEWKKRDGPASIINY